MSRFLVPLDGSACAEQILPQVRRIARAGDEITLLQVLPFREARYAPPSEASRDALWRLQTLKELLALGGVRASYALLTGDPAERILAHADETGPVLLAMSTHGRTGAARLLRGSVAERVLRESRHPLLLWNPLRNPPWRDPAGRFQTLLVPLDGSARSARILPSVRRLARAHRANVILLRVVSDGEGDARAPLARARKSFGGLPVRMLVESGNPAERILAVARREGADLVALATHGRTGAERWAFGSVAETVLRHSALPLLVVRSA